MRKTLYRLAASFLFCATAQAAPTFTWYLMPGEATLVVGKPVYVTAILVNTGTTTITGLGGYTAVATAASGYFQTFGIAGGASMEQQFAGIKLAPGESFFFTLYTFNPVNPTPGTLGLRSAGLTLRDSSGVSASTAPKNTSFTATLRNPEGWGYPGARYFTGRPENVAVSKGNLLIMARKENYRDALYTTAQLNTMGKGDWRYGRMEARMRLPTAQGMWPAFWLLSTDKFYGATNPQSGEIAILELIGREPATAHATVHTVDKQGKAMQNTTSYNLPSGKFSDGYHIFALEWDAGSIRILVDDVQYYSLSPPFPNGATWPFDKRFNIILSLGVGGDWPGPPDATTSFPQTLEVDYVRVFQRPADMTITGPEFAEPQTTVTYSVPDWPGATYRWTVDGAEIDGPADASSVAVHWGFSRWLRRMAGGDAVSG